MENRNLERAVVTAKDTFTDLVNEIESLESINIELQNEVEKLEDKIDDLKTEIEQLKEIYGNE